MASIRTNHRRNKRSHSVASFGRMIIMLIFLGVIFMIVFNKTNTLFGNQPIESESYQERFYLPKTNGELIHHKFFSLSYLENHEQPEWVAYRLTIEMLNAPKTPRTDYFNPDPFVSSGSSVHGDYIGSGFTRGHLVPAADMSFNKVAMEESFFMSNISPQKRAFNGGIWRELEELTRDWARKNKSVIIVSGPILRGSKFSKIGKNGVSVPKMFFKIILDIDEPEAKGIGFLIPNEVSDERLSKFAVTIDRIEEATGNNFFDQLLDDELEERLESSIDLNLWRFDENKYKQRVSNWNHR